MNNLINNLEKYKYDLIDNILCINGDCLDVMQDIQENSIDCILTDPPYLINYKTNRRKDKTHRFCNSILNDDNENLIKEFIQKSYNLLKDNTAFYCFCSWKTDKIFQTYIEENNFKIKNKIIWVKNNWTAGDLQAQYGQQYETILYCNKGRRFIQGKRISDVWNFSRISGKKQIHQNQKPINLLEQILEKSSNENDLILDCFAGSGSTGIACKNLNRKCILIEKDKYYYNMMVKRLKNYI